MCAGKGIALVATNGGHIRRYEGLEKYKTPPGGYACFPDVAILDPLLLRKLPACQFIVSEVDALSHAIEALGTNQATPLTDAIAYEAIRLIMKNLVPAAFVKDLFNNSNFPDRITAEMAPRDKIPEMAKWVAGRPQIAFHIRKRNEKQIMEIYELAYRGWRE